MKISSRTELMFSQAVAMAQAGRMKSTIHAFGNDIYITNMDDTIILKFKSDDEFPEKISFSADEYESPEMKIIEGRVIFSRNENGYAREKSCSAPKANFDDVKGYWDKFEINKGYNIPFSNGVVSLLEDNLSHVELETDPILKLVQKNIYTGERIEVKEANETSHLLGQDCYKGFPVIGIRTVDFKALFSLVKELTFFLQPDKNWLYFRDHSGILQGVLSTCIYDELGYIKEN